MSWSTQNRPRKGKKLLGRLQKSKVKYSTRREIIAMCDRIEELAATVDASESLVILEAAIMHLIKGVDKQSRDILFKSVNIVLGAKEYANQRNIVTPHMLSLIEKEEGALQTGIVAQRTVETLLEIANNYKLDKVILDNIIKSIIVRFALELNHNGLKEVSAVLMPNIIDKKQTEDTGHMYG